jgi:hypothetical protein
MGHTATHGYRGSLGQAQLSRPMTRCLDGPCHWGTAQRAHDEERHGVATTSAPTVASSLPTE